MIANITEKRLIQIWNYCFKVVAIVGKKIHDVMVNIKNCDAKDALDQLLF